MDIEYLTSQFYSLNLPSHVCVWWELISDSILMTDSFLADLAEKFQLKLLRVMNFRFPLALLRSSNTSSWTTSMGLNRGVPVIGRSLFLIFKKIFSWENHDCDTSS